MDETVMAGGSENAGHVVRIDNTIRRPRSEGHVVVEALLLHLEESDFIGSPRFLGIDAEGRQVLSYFQGVATDPVPWQHDDRANAAALGDKAAWLAGLHEATSTFIPPIGAAPRRSLPIPGTTWTHGDVGYSNTVYDGQRLVGLIDWEFAAPGHSHGDLAALIAMSVRGPKLDAPDNARRETALESAMSAIAVGYGLDDAEREALLPMAATIIDDAVTHWQRAAPHERFAAWRWRADRFRQIAE